MDLRIKQIFIESMQGDTSFQEKESVLSLIFGTTKYSKQEIRETWDRGIKHGIGRTHEKIREFTNLKLKLEL
jgi:hypothetical protein